MLSAYWFRVTWRPDQGLVLDGGHVVKSAHYLDLVKITDGEVKEALKRASQRL